MDANELRERFDAHGIRRVKVGGFDVDGVLRGKYLALDKFWSVLTGGFGFCDVIFGWDIGDVCYDNTTLTGPSSGYPDIQAKIDPDTFRILPYESDTAGFLLDFYGTDRKPHPACPRNLLKRVVARAEASGYIPRFGAEFEFWVFQETPATLRSKGFRDLTPLSPGMFGYSWLRTSQHQGFVRDLLECAERFDIPIEGFHTETGPGVYEAALKNGPALVAADRAALFKTLAKEVASRHGLSLTFMAKWASDLPGSSGHLHQSLWDSLGEKNLFATEKGEHGLSSLGRSYLAGLVGTLDQLTAIYSPTINSYKRYVPGVWAPLTKSWGIENRTTAVRAITGGGSTRFELRQTAADINPYLAMAASLGAGLFGIEQAMDLPPPVQGDASNGSEQPLPMSLAAAVSCMQSSDCARSILGEGFVDHYLRTRSWELRQYERAVTSWELARYFESV